MPQQLHYVVPIDLIIILKVSRDGDGELAGEADVPQQLHHVIPVYQAILIDIAGNVGHDLNVEGRRFAVVGNCNGLGTQGFRGEACGGETCGG